MMSKKQEQKTNLDSVGKENQDSSPKTGYLAERAKRGSREKLLAVLAKAPDIEPEEYDRF